MSVELRPARINTMVPEGKDHLLRTVREERATFYSLIDGTDDETWKTPTACTEWEIRDVVGHMVDVTEAYIERFTLARGGEIFPQAHGLPVMAGMLDQAAKRFRTSPRPQLISRLKESSAKLFEVLDSLTPEQWTGELIPHVYMGPLPTFFYPAFQLMDYSLHSWDIRAGLGESKPLTDDAANTLIPYMFILLKYTVDAEHAKGVDASWGVRVSGDQGGSWKLSVKDGELTYEEGSVAACPVVFNFDANEFVLNAFQRIQGGAAIGDQATARVVRELFFKI
jgi:uncharacterized protein (TIGR03083 family)